MATQTAVPRTFPQIAKFAADGRAQLLAHVDQEIAGLKIELATLQDTRRALSGKNGTVATPTPTPARSGNGQRTASRRTRTSTNKPVTEEAVMEAIRAGMGHTSPALAKALGSSQETILRRLKTLAEKGWIRREGERANSRWLIAGQTV